MIGRSRILQPARALAQSCSRMGGNLYFSSVAPRSKGTQISEDIFEKNKHSGDDFGDEPVFTLRNPGSRVLQLSYPSTGNVLNKNTTSMVKSKLESFVDNVSVQAVIFDSKSPDVFSTSFDEKSKNDAGTVSGINSMAKSIIDFTKSSGKATMTVYDGRMNGTAYAAFAGSKYRLAGPSTSLVVDELLKGVLPSGGMAYYFAKAYDGGVAMARYLAVSQREVMADDLHSMYMVTHLVEDDPTTTITDALAHTIGPNQDDKYFKSNSSDSGAVVEIGALDEILDTMHIEDVDEKMDIMKHPLWDELMLVPPERWDTLEMEHRTDLKDRDYYDDEGAAGAETAADSSSDSGDMGEGDEYLEQIETRVRKCFNTGTPEESMELLKGEDALWARECLARMSALDPALMKAWWGLTMKAHSSKAIEDVWAAEEEEF